MARTWELMIGTSSPSAKTAAARTAGVGKWVRQKKAMGAVGFEPTKAEPPDLQSGPFGHSGTRPNIRILAGREYRQIGLKFNTAPPARHGSTLRPDRATFRRCLIFPTAVDFGVLWAELAGPP